MRLSIALVLLVGILGFFGALMFSMHLSEQRELEYYKTCIDAGGSYTVGDLRASPQCRLPVDTVP